jgi:hypothetical protein
MTTFTRGCRKFCYFKVHSVIISFPKRSVSKWPLPSGFLNTVYASLISAMYAVQLGNLIYLDLIALLIFVQEYEL